MNDTDHNYTPTFGPLFEFVGNVSISTQNTIKQVAEPIDTLNAVDKTITIKATTVVNSNIGFVESAATAYAMITGDGFRFSGVVNVKNLTIKEDKYKGTSVVDLELETNQLIMLTNQTTTHVALIDKTNYIIYTDTGSLYNAAYNESNPNDFTRWGIGLDPVITWPDSLPEQAAINWLELGQVPSGWQEVGIIEL